MNILQFIFLLSFLWTFRLFPGNVKLFHEKNKNFNCPNFLSTFDNVILFPPNQKDVCNVSGILVHIFLLLMRMKIYLCVCVYVDIYVDICICIYQPSLLSTSMKHSFKIFLIKFYILEFYMLSRS